MITVIDIGTNTIRAVKLNGFYEVDNLSERSRILEHTENGRLTEFGVADLVAKLKKLTQNSDTKPYAFATSAFRSLKNKEEVALCIEETLGFHIDILSGEEEAECDAISLMRKKEVESGIGADLGGGSCQIFAFDTNGITSKSVPLGVKRLQTQFVSEIIPTKTERENINNYVKSRIDFPKCAKTLYIMGGTARAMLKLTRTLTGNEISKFSIAKFRSIADFAFDRNTLPTIKRILPKRFDSVGIGIDVICQIAEAVGAGCIEIVDCSVREGYIINKIQKNSALCQ